MKQWIHFTGIAGRAIANVAIMYQSQGYFVTGSDNNALPPATDFLDAASVPYVKDYHYTHLTKSFWEQELKQKLEIADIPNRVIAVSTISKKNKEYLFAQAQSIPVQTFAQALGKDLVKSESIVVVGTAGKSTTTALLIELFSQLELDPSYMVGVEFADGRPVVKNTKSDWSILEGDEFYGVEMEPHSKFFEYHPKYLILTAAVWDHADVFPTEEAYVQNFINVVKQLPGNGLLIANAADANVRRIAQHASCGVRWFSAFEEVDEFINVDGKKLYWHLTEEEGKLTAHSYEPVPFNFTFTTKLLGKYNRQNILAAVALIYELFAHNTNWDIIENAIRNFPGLHKRLEIIHQQDGLVIVDDLGGPTLKVDSGLSTLDETFPGYYKVVVYEPNTGARTRALLSTYPDAFKLADEIIIPTLSDFDANLLSQDEIVQYLREQLPNTSISAVATEDLQARLLAKVTEFDGQSDDKMGSVEIPEQKQSLMIVLFSPFRLTQIGRDLMANLPTTN